MDSRISSLQKLRYETVKAIHATLADKVNEPLLTFAEKILSNTIPAQDIEAAYTQLTDLVLKTGEDALASVLTTLSFEIAQLTQLPDPDCSEEAPDFGRKKTIAAEEKPIATKPFSFVTPPPEKIDIILSLLKALRKQVVASIVDKVPADAEHGSLLLYGMLINNNETDSRTFPTFIQLAFKAASKSPKKTLSIFAALLNMLHKSIQNITPSDQEDADIKAAMDKLSIEVSEIVSEKLSPEEEIDTILTIGTALQNLTGATPLVKSQELENDPKTLPEPTAKPSANLAIPVDFYSRWYSLPFSLWSNSTTLSETKSTPAAIKKLSPSKPEDPLIYMGVPKKILDRAQEQEQRELLELEDNNERQFADYKTYPRC